MAAKKKSAKKTAAKKAPSKKTVKKTPAKKAPAKARTKKTPTTKKAPATKKPPATATNPALPTNTAPATGGGSATGLRVRMYRVGFGDFFLLTVPSDAGPQHILIDCGVTPGTTHKGDIGTIKNAVADMAKETGNKLALVIMTHRHMDHIIGFSRCADVFKNIKVGAVWMPYWETDYDAQGKPSAASNFQQELTALAFSMQQHLALNARPSQDDEEMLGMLRNATGVDHDGLPMAAAAAGGAAAKTGTGGGSNAASLAMLKTGFGVKPEYYAKGDPVNLPPALAAAGLTAEILGPPPEETAATFMKLTDLKKGVGQYLGVGASEDDDGSGKKKFDPFGGPWHAKASEYPASAFREWVPRDKDAQPAAANRRLEDAVKAAQPELLFTAVKALDSFLNNQSLVVLFTVQGKKLLFVGDAQAGNWEYWMYGGTPNAAPSITALTAEGKTILGNLDFYKVGHHGSTNATPVTAVEAMGGNFAAMCSTQLGAYGNPDKGTEVPRTPLLDALGKKSALVRSDQIAVTLAGNAVPPVPNLPASPGQPTRGSYVVGDIYVDYLF
jgi:beta-lactamase superfamily II metal-dependent hydrolase